MSHWGLRSDVNGEVQFYSELWLKFKKGQCFTEGNVPMFNQYDSLITLELLQEYIDVEKLIQDSRDN